MEALRFGKRQAHCCLEQKWLRDEIMMMLMMVTIGENDDAIDRATSGQAIEYDRTLQSNYDDCCNR